MKIWLARRRGYGLELLETLLFLNDALITLLREPLLVTCKQVLAGQQYERCKFCLSSF